MLWKKNAISQVPLETQAFYSNVFLVHKAVKTVKCTPYLNMCLLFLSSSTIKSGDFTLKIDLEDTYMYFYILVHPESKVALLYLHEQGVSFLGTPISSQHSFPGIVQVSKKNAFLAIFSFILGIFQ